MITRKQCCDCYRNNSKHQRNMIAHMSLLVNTMVVFVIWSIYISPTCSYLTFSFYNYKNLFFYTYKEYLEYTGISIFSKLTTGLGGAMVQRSCSNGHAICKDLSSSPTYDHWSFPACKKVSPLKKSNPKAAICAMCPNNLA